VPTTITGNPNLRNERADSFTFGAVLRPRFLPGFTASADYVHIALKDAIVALGGDQVLDACYDAVNYPSSFCKMVTRNSAGQITMIDEGYYNASAAKLKAVTADIDYRFDLRAVGLGDHAGQVDLGVHYYHLINQYTRIGNGDIDHTVGEIGNPRDSFTANLNYTKGGVNLLWQTEYFGPSVIDADAPPSAYQYPGISHWFLFNASIGGTIDGRYDLRLIVDNVTNARPPFPTPAGGGTITYFSGIVGRAFRITAGIRL
jgi:outer membrane receptor protein involved in Fe transport